MRGRDTELEFAIALIEDGESVDVVGGRNSGRSTFLAELRSRLELDGWKVVVVRGVASLQAHGYSAMHLADIGAPSRSSDLSTLQATAAALRASTDRQRSVLFLDDWDDLDETSWGVAEAVRRSSGLPLVRARLLGRSARHTPSGLTASTLDPTYVIDMTALEFGTLEQVVAAALGGPVDRDTMSRIYLKSGGNVGLALSLVKAAVREDRIVARADGIWVATRELWSPKLRAIMEAQLEGIDQLARDALEVIALVGVADLETVRLLVDWATLEDLEARSMIVIVTSGDRQLVTVIPPLLVDYFRHDTQVARHTRLSELVLSRIGEDANATTAIARFDFSSSVAPNNEQLAWLLSERKRARLFITRSEWKRVRIPSTAVRYLTALLHVNGRAEEIETVLKETAIEGDPMDRADFLAFKARWLAHVAGDLDAALALLDQHRTTLGAYAPLLSAERVALLLQLRRLPEDYVNQLEISEKAPEDVVRGVLEVQMLVNLSLGRFADVCATFARLDEFDDQVASPMPRVYNGYALFGLGKQAEADAQLWRGLEESQGALDIDAINAYGTALTQCLAVEGDFRGLESVLDTMSAAGVIPRLPFGVDARILIASTAVAVRRGNAVAAEAYALEARALGEVDGVLPGQSAAWAVGIWLASTGDYSGAATALWASAETLWERGARFAACAAGLSSLEVHFDRARFPTVEGWVNVVGGPLLESHLEYVRASRSNDPEQLVATAAALYSTGRFGLALAALRMAEKLYFANRELKRAEEVAAILERYLAELAPREIEVARYESSTIGLSEREREVARLAAADWSNQQIAESMVLSVRTVESHMHNILRKLDLPSRRALSSRQEAFQD